MSDLTSKLVPLFDGAVTDADRIARPDGSTVEASLISNAASIASVAPLASIVLALPAFITADANGVIRPLQPTEMYDGFIVTRGVWLDTGERYDPVNDTSGALALAKSYVFLPPFADGADMIYPTLLVQGTGQVPAGYSATTGQPFGTGSASAVVWDPGEVVVVPVSPTNVNVFRKGANPASARYIRYNFYRFTDASATVAGDVWRLGEQWEATRTGEFSFTDVRRLGNDAETDTAIWVSYGVANDGDGLIGGKEHGGEKIDPDTTPYALMDGLPYDLLTPRRGRSFEFFQRTIAYKWNCTISGSTATKTDLSATVVARLSKHHRFGADGYQIDQQVVWGGGQNLRRAYFGMGVIYRVNNTADQITNRGYLDPIWAPLDLTNAGYADITSTASQAKLSGPLGISWSWRDLGGAITRYFATGRTFFRDTSTRNKFYPDYAGGSTANPAAPSAGETWAVSSIQNLTTSN